MPPKESPGPIDWLVLVPTQLERDSLDLQSSPINQASSLHLSVEIVGFGPIVSAATTANLLAELKPKKCLLAGIAGGFGPVAPGDAFLAEQVFIDGIGVGEGENHRSAFELGWSFGNHQGLGFEKSLELARASNLDVVTGKLLTVCSSADNKSDAQRRLKRFPGCLAEDMESYSVAWACQSKSIPLLVVRGISNMAGDRDRKNWDIEKAMKSVSRLVNRILIDAD